MAGTTPWFASTEARGYQRRARLAGQQLKCDLIRTGRSGNRLNYNVRNCSP